MALDPELFKQLLVTFKAELDEKAQLIVNGILKIENESTPDHVYQSEVATIFRAAHNIKGSARSLGINPIGDIAHQLESLFSTIEKERIKVSPELIDLTLESVDKMRTAMSAFIDNQLLPFDLAQLLDRLMHVLDKKNAKEKMVTQSEESQTRTIAEKRNSKTDDSIRVSTASIDRISSYMEDLQANKIGFQDHYEELKRTVTSNKLSKYIESIKTRIGTMDVITSALQDELRMLRLVPVSVLFDALPRYARDISHDLNKKIILEITGDEIKIDKMILERLKDPLNHLLRNCIDHGIESNEIRQKEGKPESGQIKIDIKEKENQVCITITDDGKGIDVKKVSDVALAKNMVSKTELDAMNETEILSLIFQHGFSTKEMITDISGRGIGLDVVKNNIENMNGYVQVHTSLGKFTTFTLHLPLTLSSERGLLIKMAQQLFVVPTSAVKRVLAIKADDIFSVEGGQAIMFDQRPVPFCALSDVFALPQRHDVDPTNMPVIILTNMQKAVAILVGDVIGEREIVIKPLQPPLDAVSCVSGGTLYGNNQVVPILDSVELIDRALTVEKSYQSVSEVKESEEIERPHILVVDDSITTRTLEKNILESRNYQVTVAVNGKEAWDMIQKRKFSLIITDIAMPIMDGFELTDMIKQSDKFNQIPVVIVTSLGSDEEKKRGVTVGANAYIIKHEFESGALLEIIEQLI
jgi:two-component system chemotaxis sensor kinase CheA